VVTPRRARIETTASDRKTSGTVAGELPPIADAGDGTAVNHDALTAGGSIAITGDEIKGSLAGRGPGGWIGAGAA
jgi:hypothetical protein